MPAYRLHLLNAAGRIESTREIMVPDDKEAQFEAALLQHVHAVEVWQDDRRLAVVYPNRRGGTG